MRVHQIPITALTSLNHLMQDNYFRRKDPPIRAIRRAIPGMQTFLLYMRYLRHGLSFCSNRYQQHVEAWTSCINPSNVLTVTLCRSMLAVCQQESIELTLSISISMLGTWWQKPARTDIVHVQINAGGSLANTLANMGRLSSASEADASSRSQPLRVAAASIVGCDALGSFHSAQQSKAGVTTLSPLIPDSCTGDTFCFVKLVLWCPVQAIDLVWWRQRS